MTKRSKPNGYGKRAWRVYRISYWSWRFYWWAKPKRLFRWAALIGPKIGRAIVWILDRLSGAKNG